MNGIQSTLRERYSVHTPVHRIIECLKHFERDRNRCRFFFAFHFASKQWTGMHGTRSARHKCSAFTWTTVYCVETINTFVLNAEFSDNTNATRCAITLCVMICSFIAQTFYVCIRYYRKLTVSPLKQHIGIAAAAASTMLPVEMACCDTDRFIRHAKWSIVCMYLCVGKIVADKNCTGNSISSSLTVSNETLSKQFTTKTHSIHIAVNAHTATQTQFHRDNDFFFRFVEYF